MKVLLVGSGGREHALAWKIAASPLLTRLVIAPGNPGMERLGELRPIKADDVDGLVALAREMSANLVVVGPEAALAAGVADRLAEVGVPCFGPTAAAARLESSKAFTKAFADRHDVPTAAYGVFERVEDAVEFLDRRPPPYVVKADGLAAGKGVVIASDRDDAVSAVAQILNGAASCAVLEEFMDGEEASLFAICDGERAVFFGGAQDHKRAYDGDDGPNTGGMGAYSPAPVLDDAVQDRAWREIVQPTLAGMVAEGAPFRGVLYAGLMIKDGAPRLVEFNARLGDPECQVLMLRLKSDLLPYLHAAATGDLGGSPQPEWRDGAAVCVVLASNGYPDAPETGTRIDGAEQDFGPDVAVFHAGTQRGPDGGLLAAGGRVLNVCARGRDVTEARERAYAAVAQIRWPGGFYRTDIGWRAVAREGDPT